MKTLRIINQNLDSTEIARNICLEGNDYDVIWKVNNNVVKKESEGENLFKLTMRQHFDGPFEDDTIVAFVCGKNKTYPVRNYEVAYVINDEGKTIERIYGQYQKY